MQNEKSKTIKKASIKKAVTPKTVAAEVSQKAKKTAPKKETSSKSTTKKTVKDAIVTVTFQLTYATQFGQNIYLSGNAPQLGNNHDENALKLQYIDVEHWAAEVKLNKEDFEKEGLKYYYIIQNEDGSIEKSAPYFLLVDELTKNVFVSDAWNYTGYVQNAFSTKVFDVLNDKTVKKNKKASSKKSSHSFKINAPELPTHYTIFLLGNCKSLGNWEIENVILLSLDETSGAWVADINIMSEDGIIEYKYGVYDLDKKILVTFEDGSNRTLATPDTKASHVIINDGFIRSSN